MAFALLGGIVGKGYGNEVRVFWVGGVTDTVRQTLSEDLISLNTCDKNNVAQNAMKSYEC